MASRNKNIVLEEYEWTDFWWDNRDVDAKNVLMIGDSQTRGMRPYFSQLCPQLKVDMFATSKCADNPDYMREIKYVLEEYKYEYIFFSHGLHGWHLSIEDYAEKCGEVMDLLTETGAKIIVENCLPVALAGEDFILDNERNAIVLERNSVLKELSDKMKLEFLDLYSAVIDKADIRDNDGMHYNEAGYRFLTQKLTERIGI